MSEDRRASHADNQDFLPSCVAAIWFDLVDSYIQHGGDQADDKVIKAENKHLC
jgi:hypothetical protein